MVSKKSQETQKKYVSYGNKVETLNHAFFQIFSNNNCTHCCMGQHRITMFYTFFGAQRERTTYHYLCQIYPCVFFFVGSETLI